MYVNFVYIQSVGCGTVESKAATSTHHIRSIEIELIAKHIAMKSCLAVVAMFAMLVQSVRADKWAGKQLVVLQRDKGGTV